jgi:hypothetical protein
MVKTPQAIAILDSREPASCPRPSRGKPSKSQSWSQKRRNSSPESHHCPDKSRSQQRNHSATIVARREIDRSTSIAAQQATIARLRAQQQGEIQTQQATIARLQAELRNAISEDQPYSQLYQQQGFPLQLAKAKASPPKQPNSNSTKERQN